MATLRFALGPPPLAKPLGAFTMRSVKHGIGTDQVNGERKVADRLRMLENLLST
jgi:hypothetical protein